MFDDFDTDLFGNPVLPSLGEVVAALSNDFDLCVVSKRKLTSNLRRSLNNDFYISDVLCHQLFPELSSLEVERFNDDANLRFV